MRELPSRERALSGTAASSEVASSLWSRRGRYRLVGDAWGSTLTLCIVTGFFATSIYGLSNGGVQQLSSAAMLGGACLCLGGLLGFLFAIPRYLVQDASSRASPNSESFGIRYDPNDNLVQISDWLTKILVGVGLTQITKVPEFLERFGEYFGQSLGDSGKSVSITILILFSISGFLFGYIWTRIFFAGELYLADEKNKETISRLREIDTRMKIDNLYILAVNAEQNRDYARAETYFKEVIEVDRDNVKAKASLADLYVNWDTHPNRVEKLAVALELCVECEAAEGLSASLLGGVLIIHAAVSGELADYQGCAASLRSAILHFRESGTADDRIMSYIRGSKKLIEATKRDSRVAKTLDALDSSSERDV